MPAYDPDLSKWWHSKQWEWIPKNLDKVSIIAIYSWNEYHENSHVETSRDAYTGDPWSLHNTTKHYTT